MKETFRVSRKVPPGGYAFTAAVIAVGVLNDWEWKVFGDGEVKMLCWGPWRGAVPRPST